MASLGRFARLAAVVCLVATIAAAPALAQDGAPDDMLKRFDRESSNVVERASTVVVGVSIGNKYGSGFVVAPGLVITTTGVVTDASKTVNLLLSNRKMAKGKVVAMDQKLNAVLILTHNKSIKPMRWANSDDVAVGSGVYTLGNPYASIQLTQKIAVSYGTVSGRYKVEGDRFYRDEVLETTAAINHGSFGGPLVDSRGRVIGMIHRSVSYKRWLGVGIPSKPLIAFVDRYKAGKTTIELPPKKTTPTVTKKTPKGEPAFLGVKADTTRIRMGRMMVTVARVLEVAPDSPAADAGLKKGDLIFRVGKVICRSSRALSTILSGQVAGAQVTITWGRRQGRGLRQFNKKVTLTSRPL